MRRRRVEYTRMNPPPPPTATAMISFVASKCEISARRSEDGKRNYTGYKKWILGTWGGSYLKKRTHGVMNVKRIENMAIEDHTQVYCRHSDTKA